MCLPWMKMIVMMMTLMMTLSRTESMNRPGGATSDLCYYQPYYKQLTCSCHNNDLKSEQFLNIKLGYYVRQLGQEVLHFKYLPDID